MDYFKTHKYGTAVTLSAAVHILAFFLVSSWVVDHRVNNPKETKVIIHNVRLEEPVKPEPIAIEATPITSAEAVADHRVEPVRMEARPVINFSDHEVRAKIPARLSSHINMAKLQASLVSPGPPSMDAFNDAAARSSADVIQYSLVKPQAMNAEAQRDPVNDALSESNFKPIKMISSAREFQKQAAKVAQKKLSAERPATEISPIGMVGIFSSAKVEWPGSISPVSIADSEPTEAVTVSPAIRANFQITKFSAPKVTPTNMTSGSQTIFSKDPVRLAGFPNAAKTSSPASPAQPGNETFSSMAYKPSKVSISKSLSGPPTMIAVAKKYSLNNSVKETQPTGTVIVSAHSKRNSLGNAAQELIVESYAAVHPANMTDFQTINFIENKSSPIIERETGSAVSGIKPTRLAGFDRTVTSGASRLPVIMAAVPQDFIFSDQDRKNSPEELRQLKANFTRKVRDRIALVKMYPRRARSRGFEGQPVVAFTLSRNGGLTKYSIVKSSGHQILDKSALESVKKAVPYPPIPDKLNIESINLKLPISYILK